jgi:hypothetical protein
MEDGGKRVGMKEYEDSTFPCFLGAWRKQA